MQLISVNVGKAQPIAAKSGSSGIFKQGTQETVAYTPYEWNKIPDGVRIDVMEMFRFDLARNKSADELRRYLRAPIAIRAREYYEGLLK